MATADNTFRNRANALIESFSGEAPRAFMSMPTYLANLETVITGLQIIVIGPLTSPKTHELAAAVHGRSLPNLTFLIVDPNAVIPEGHPAFGKTMENGQPTAYVCQRMTCSAPITNPVALSQILQLPQRAAGNA
jgi:hypothetical protein